MKFELKQVVVIRETKQHATVTGRAEYVNSEPSYRLRYVSAQGNQCDDWFDENALDSF